MKASNFRNSTWALLAVMIPSMALAGGDSTQPGTAPAGGQPAAKTTDKAAADKKAADDKAAADKKAADDKAAADKKAADDKVAADKAAADKKAADDKAAPDKTASDDNIKPDEWYDLGTTADASKYFTNFSVQCSDIQSDGSCNKAQLVGSTFKECVSDASQYKISNSATDKSVTATGSRGFRIQLKGSAESCISKLSGQKCSREHRCVRLSELDSAASALNLKALDYDGSVALYQEDFGDNQTGDKFKAEAVVKMTVKSEKTRQADLKAKKDQELADRVKLDRQIVAYCPVDRARASLSDLISLGQLTASDIDAASKVIDKRELKDLIDKFNKAKMGSDDAELAALSDFAKQHPDSASDIAKAIMARLDKVKLSSTDTTDEDRYMDALSDLAGSNADIVKDIANAFYQRVQKYNTAAKAADTAEGLKLVSRAVAIVDRTKELDLNESTIATLDGYIKNDLADTKMNLMALKGYSNNPDLKTLVADRQKSACSELQASCDSQTIQQAQQSGMCQQSSTTYFLMTFLMTTTNGQSNQSKDPDACTHAKGVLTKVQTVSQGAVAIDCSNIQQQGGYPNLQTYQQCSQIMAKYQQQGQGQQGPAVGPNGQPVGPNGQPIYNAQGPTSGPGYAQGAPFGSNPARTQMSAAFGPQQPGVDMSHTWGMGSNVNPALQMPMSSGAPFQSR